MNVRQFSLACIAVMVISPLLADARPLTEDETSILQHRNEDREWRTDNSKWKAAEALIEQLGTGRDLDIVPLLLSFNSSQMDPHFIDTFFNHYNRGPQAGSGSPEIDQVVISMIQYPGFIKKQPAASVKQFLQAATRHPSPQTWHIYYDVVKQAFLEYSPDPTSKQYIQAGEWDIVSLLTSPDMSHTEEPMAALLPILRDTCQGGVLIKYLGERHYVESFDRIRDLYERTSRSANIGCNNGIISALALFQTREATELIAQHLRWLVTQAPKDKRLIDSYYARMRNFENRSHTAKENAEHAELQAQIDKVYRRDASDAKINAVLSELGVTRIEAQIDYEALEREVLGQQVDAKRRSELEALFKAVNERARRAREFTTTNLFYWIELNNRKPALVQSFIEHGVDVDAVNGIGQSPICAALASNGYEIVHILVEGGADINRLGNGRGCLPLGLITAQPLNFDHYLPEAAYLLEHGAHVDGMDGSGWTALHHAAYAGNTRLMELLLVHGANVNAKVNKPNPNGDPFLGDGATPLHFAVSNAAYHGDEAVQILLQHKADVNTQTAAGATPLAIAVYRRQGDVYMHNHPRPPHPLDRNASPEHIAARLTKSENLVRMLIEHGADVTLGWTDFTDNTPIIFAHENEDTSMEELLHSKGAFLNPLILAKRKAIEAASVIMWGGGGH